MTDLEESRGRKSDKGRDLSLNRRPGEAAHDKATQEREIAMAKRPILGSLARAFNTKTDEPALRFGASGKDKVSRKLEKLIPFGWRVLHSVPIGKGDSVIDHVIVGPGGVFTINDKFHRGARMRVEQDQIYVNRKPVDYLRESRIEGKLATRLLTKAAGFPVKVMPCLVLLVGGMEPSATYKQRPDDVLVLDSRNVHWVFRRWTGELEPDVVDAIFEVARWESAWRG